MIRRSKKGVTRGVGAASAVLLSLALPLAVPTVMPPMFPGCSAYYAYAQAPAKVRNIAVDFVPEPGCPIGPMSMRCELDCDAFDAPMDARVYLDYKNNSDRAVSAVKFRLRFVDGDQKDRGTFHVLGPAAGPQGVGGVKAKRDITLHPSIVGLKVRVLAVKYSDGSDWSSVKMQELVQPSVAPASSSAPPALPSSINSAPMVDEAADTPARPGASTPPAAYSTSPPASAPYSTGVRGKTYEVAPPGATQSYSSLNGAGAAPVMAPAMPQGISPPMTQGAAQAMPQAAAQAAPPGAAALPDANAVAPAPFYTPPPTPKLGTSPVFNPLNEPDSAGTAGAPAQASAPAQVPASTQASAPPQASAPAQASAPPQAQSKATTAPTQAVTPATAANNVFAKSPMATSDLTKQPTQASQSSANAFAAGAPGANYAPAINAAQSGASAGATTGATAAAASAAQAVANPGTSPNTSANTSANTSNIPVSGGSNKAPEPINTPWHP